MNDIKTYCIIGTVLTTVLGVVLHFVFEWTNENSLAAVFGAVNESTWEHLKLLFWPTLIFSVVEFFLYGKNYEGFITVKAISIILGLLFIVVAFYTYTGILGQNYAPIDISIFIIAVIISYFFSYVMLDKYPLFGSSVAAIVLSMLVLLLLALFFTVFSFYTPEINLFRDPISGNYGIQ